MQKQVESWGLASCNWTFPQHCISTGVLLSHGGPRAGHGDGYREARRCCPKETSQQSFPSTAMPRKTSVLGSTGDQGSASHLTQSPAIIAIKCSANRERNSDSLGAANDSAQLPRRQYPHTRAHTHTLWKISLPFPLGAISLPFPFYALVSPEQMPGAHPTLNLGLPLHQHPPNLRELFQMYMKGLKVVILSWQAWH